MVSPSVNGFNYSERLISKSVWDVLPMEHTEYVNMPDGFKTDAFNPFYHYFYRLSEKSQPHPEFDSLPLWDSWAHYPEAYHNHMHRFRGKKRIVFMEVGVQSGGKIPLMRDYFGPGLQYVGIDINPETKRYEGADWVQIEIGDSSDRRFWSEIRKKHPHVDIFLDDGGHQMNQQIIAMEEMLPHVHREGVFICEDTATSWSRKHGGVRKSDVRSKTFRNKTYLGLVHKTLDWFMAGFMQGRSAEWGKYPKDSFFDKSWWKVIPEQVKHIHYYNQIVVYEKGVTYPATRITTVGNNIPYKPTGHIEHVSLEPVIKELSRYTNSTWRWV